MAVATIPTTNSLDASEIIMHVCTTRLALQLSDPPLQPEWCKGRLAFLLTPWYRVDGGRYLAIDAHVNLEAEEGEEPFTFRVVEGFTIDEEDRQVVVGDAFVDIKVDPVNLQDAVDNMVCGTIPLCNRDGPDRDSRYLIR
jgi:hypothetical protein